MPVLFFLFLKTQFLRFHYRFFPSKTQAFWGQALLSQPGLGSKLGQIFAQGKIKALPLAHFSKETALKLILKHYPELDGEVSFDGPVFSASMGQVFFIKIKNQPFAIKILHRKLQASLKKEIKNLMLLGKFYSKVKGFVFREKMFLNFLEETLAFETDLIREATYQKKFREFFLSKPSLVIPAVISAYSNSEMLCQERIEAVLAEKLTAIDHYMIFDFFFKSLFELGVLYSDLNDRNWGVLENKKIVVYDFGSTLPVTPRRRLGLVKLLRGESSIEAFMEFGLRVEASPFANKTEHLRSVLFSPLNGPTYDPRIENYSLMLKVKLGEDALSLREIADPWILLFLRGLFSLVKTYQRFGMLIPFQELLSPYLGLQTAEKHTLLIKVQVLQEKKLKVYLEFPLSSLDDLEFLIPSHVLKKMESTPKRLKELIQTVKDSGYKAQELFALESESKSYRVWIG